MSTHHSAMPTPGDLVSGRYRVEGVIGTGGMAVVYRATDEELGRTVALKVFRADVVDAASVARQTEEIRLIASLDHPALVTLYDAVPAVTGDENSTGVLVMQHVEGRDLRHRLAEGALPAPTVAAIGADVAAALAYVHGRGVIHRDISPANVLLPETTGDGAPAARLADFGIARLVDSAGLTQTGTVIGTATYLSPEQAEGKPLGPASDIYSLGLTLLESLTAQRAFPGTAIESATARLTSDPVIPGALGEGWTTLLGAMTSRDPSARPTAVEVGAALRERALEPVEPLEGTALMPTAVLPAATTPTAVLPARADQATAVLSPTVEATTVLPAAVTSAPPAEASPTDRRRPLIVLGALGAALVVAVIIASLAGLGSGAPTSEDDPAASPASASPEPSPEPVAPQEPEYPAVAGAVGTALAALQQLVTFDRLDETLARALQQQVFSVATLAASGDLDGAKDQLEVLKDEIDAAADAGTLAEPASKELRAAVDAVKKALEDAIDAAKGDDKPGKGPKKPK